MEKKKVKKVKKYRGKKEGLCAVRGCHDSVVEVGNDFCDLH